MQISDTICTLLLNLSESYHFVKWLFIYFKFVINVSNNPKLLFIGIIIMQKLLSFINMKHDEVNIVSWIKTTKSNKNFQHT